MHRIQPIIMIFAVTTLAIWTASVTVEISSLEKQLDAQERTLAARDKTITEQAQGITGRDTLIDNQAHQIMSMKETLLSQCGRK